MGRVELPKPTNIVRSDSTDVGDRPEINEGLRENVRTQKNQGSWESLNEYYLIGQARRMSAGSRIKWSTCCACEIRVTGVDTLGSANSRAPEQTTIQYGWKTQYAGRMEVHKQGSAKGRMEFKARRLPQERRKPANDSAKEARTCPVPSALPHGTLDVQEEGKVGVDGGVEGGEDKGERAGEERREGEKRGAGDANGRTEKRTKVMGGKGKTDVPEALARRCASPKAAAPHRIDRDEGARARPNPRYGRSTHIHSTQAQVRRRRWRARGDVGCSWVTPVFKRVSIGRLVLLALVWDWEDVLGGRRAGMRRGQLRRRKGRDTLKRVVVVVGATYDRCYWTKDQSSVLPSSTVPPTPYSCDLFEIE
ncbi:hypothetical protein DFH06DRAFT_1125388 [Mycena polygramma]|nr:hypothetical protein DFH06DRAFT_1125388 [Mycena polygramma]